MMSVIEFEKVLPQIASVSLTPLVVKEGSEGGKKTLDFSFVRNKIISTKKCFYNIHHVSLNVGFLL